jgi:hypothetical protein
MFATVISSMPPYRQKNLKNIKKVERHIDKSFLLWNDKTISNGEPRGKPLGLSPVNPLPASFARRPGAQVPAAREVAISPHDVPARWQAWFIEEREYE